LVLARCSTRNRPTALAVCGVFGSLLLTGAAHAGPLVTNGNFSQNSTLATEASQSASYNAANNTGYLSGVAGTNAQASQVTGWSFGAAGSFDFMVDLNTYGTVYSPGAPGTNGTVAFWDQGDSHYSSFWSTPGADPSGSMFAIASDPNHLNAAITQSLTGLVVGDRYQVTFNQASAQQYGYSGAFTAAWQVSLGGQTGLSATMNNLSQQSTPWTTQTLDFIATSSTETLSFLSTASVGSNPPFLLLGDVGLDDIPEPASIGMTLLATALVIGAQRRRGRKAA
jgi:hypothetical protein